MLGEVGGVVGELLRRRGGRGILTRRRARFDLPGAAFGVLRTAFGFTLAGNRLIDPRLRVVARFLAGGFLLGDGGFGVGGVLSGRGDGELARGIARRRGGDGRLEDRGGVVDGGGGLRGDVGRLRGNRGVKRVDRRNRRCVHALLRKNRAHNEKGRVTLPIGSWRLSPRCVLMARATAPSVCVPLSSRPLGLCVVLPRIRRKLARTSN